MRSSCCAGGWRVFGIGAVCLFRGFGRGEFEVVFDDGVVEFVFYDFVASEVFAEEYVEYDAYDG